MDINEQLKGWLQQQAQPGSFLDKAGLGLAQAGQTIGQDAAAGAAIMNDPRNSWIGMNPVGRAVGGGLGLLGMITKGAGKYAQFGLPEVKAGASSTDLAGGLLLPNTGPRVEHFMDYGVPEAAQNIKNLVEDDGFKALHDMVEMRLKVGRATGTGLSNPKDPIYDFLEAFPEANPRELGGLILTHHQFKPGFYERLMEPKVLESLLAEAKGMVETGKWGTVQGTP